MSSNLSNVGDQKIRSILADSSFHNKSDQLFYIFSHSPLRELHAAFPAILANIFGYDHTDGWKLSSLTQGNDSVTFRVVESFLSPTGPLFATCNRLEQAGMLFVFPISCVPPPSQKSLLSPNGIIPPFYSDKLPANTPVPCSHLTLKAFDFYFFHFAYYIIYSQRIAIVNAANINPWQSLSSCIYTRLLELYLNHFLPISDTFSQETTTPFLNKNQPTSPSRFAHTRSTQSPLRSHSQDRIVDTYSINLRFFLTMVEFWFRQFEYLSPTDNFISRGISQTQNFTHVMTNIHSRLTRILTKHIHYFSNSISCPFPLLKLENLPPAMFRHPFFQFLRYSISHAHINPSFRMLIELWLTYIQPWRYIDINLPPVKSSHATNIPIDARWESFVTDNLPFYSVLFMDFLSKVIWLNLQQAQDITLLQRVTRVFSQPGLPQIIHSAEILFLENIQTKPVPAPQPHETLNPKPQSSIVNKIIDITGKTIPFTPMMTTQTAHMFDEIITSIENIIAQIKKGSSLAAQTVNFSSRFTNWFLNIFSEPEGNELDVWGEGQDDTTTANNREKIIAQLNQCLTYMRNLFNKHSDDNNNIHVFSNNSANESSIFETSQTFRNTSLMNNAEVSVKNRELDFLSEKKHLLNNTKNIIKISYMGDPMLKPITTYENRFLCRKLYQISQFFNQKLENKLTYLDTNTTSYWNLLAKLYLSKRPKLHPLYEIPTPVNTVKPNYRINLRFLSSYYVIFILLLLLYYSSTRLTSIESLQLYLAGFIIYTLYSIIAMLRADS